jgi:hypothetical protein
MRLELQCCTVSQGKRLTELGVNALSHFTHTIVPDGSVITTTETGLHRKYEHYPAYTVAELGAMLPVSILNYTCDLKILNDGDTWICGYDYDVSTDGGYGASVKEWKMRKSNYLLAECMAAALIHLLESKLITPEQCNENLNK